MRRHLAGALLAALVLPASAGAYDDVRTTVPVELQATHLCRSVESAAGQALTVNLPVIRPGLRHMITVLEVSRASASTVAGNATLAITTSNLPGDPRWRVGNGIAAGGRALDVSWQLTYPLRAEESAATTITLPAAGAGGIWTVNVCGFGAY